MASHKYNVMQYHSPTAKLILEKKMKAAFFDLCRMVSTEVAFNMFSSVSLAQRQLWMNQFEAKK